MHDEDDEDDVSSSWIFGDQTEKDERDEREEGT